MDFRTKCPKTPDATRSQVWGPLGYGHAAPKRRGSVIGPFRDICHVRVFIAWTRSETSVLTIGVPFCFAFNIVKLSEAPLYRYVVEPRKVSKQ